MVSVWVNVSNVVSCNFSNIFSLGIQGINCEGADEAVPDNLLKTPMDTLKAHNAECEEILTGRFTCANAQLHGSVLASKQLILAIACIFSSLEGEPCKRVRPTQLIVFNLQYGMYGGPEVQYFFSPPLNQFSLNPT